MKGLFIFLGVVLNSIGLLFFGEAIIHRAMEAGAPTAGFFDGLLGLLLINIGILLLLIAAGFRNRP